MRLFRPRPRRRHGPRDGDLVAVANHDLVELALVGHDEAAFFEELLEHGALRVERAARRLGSGRDEHRMLERDHHALARRKLEIEIAAVGVRELRLTDRPRTP